MQNNQDVNDSIIKTTTEIGDKFPELSKFIDEMPLLIPDESSPEINSEVLEDYQLSLKSLLTKYSASHLKTKNK
ncbi:MAG: hypothetical protein ACOVO1_07410 [Chitinophagaceae bacterium]